MLKYPLSVFLDTNIFIGCRYDLHEDSVLIKLKNLVDHNKVIVYISNVVLRETEKHIKLDILEAVHELKNTRKNISKKIAPTILKDTPLGKIFDLSFQDTIEETALTKFREFLNESKVIYLDNEGIDIDSILDDYFNGNAPFENKEAKKYEFPDAFIISKLKKEFCENKPIWVISCDEGFKKALTNERGFNYLSSIKELLDMINKQDEIIMYNAIKEYIENKDSYKEICNIIKDKIESDEVDVDGLYYDRKGYCGGYEYSYNLINDVSVENINLSSIDDISEDMIHLTIVCKAKIDVSCFYNDYDNSIWDSDEKEYMFLSEGEIKEEHEPEFECSLSVKVNHEGNNIEFSICDISYDLALNQYSRVKQSLVELEDD
ncbi:PIN domain-containing protein [Paraclostridium bifermentans]|uniref:PIN domain-containing protein n=1 Tax=Paraclostridium bifermentans TaxID=1490 RepID=UPI0022E7546F|nr:PIN domain-containing protein [Paraclostridium bifermentans]